MATVILFILSIIYPMNIGAEPIRLSIGEKQYFYFPGLKKIENFNSKLINARVLPEENKVILTALSKGNGKLFVDDNEGNRTLDVIVYSKLSLDLEREIKELTSHIEGLSVRNIGHKVVIKGKVFTSKDFETLKTIEKQYENVLLLIESSPSAQALILQKMIYLDVKMIEMNKNKLETLGIQFPEAVTTHLSYAAHLNHKTETDLIFHALEKKGYAKTLANPKLVCKSGEEAHFTAGGEIPLKLAHEKKLSVQWKTYGILLHVKPIADTYNQIAATLKVEISQLNRAASVDGIPGLSTRKLETSVNVPEGKTIILSGLIHQENGQDFQKLPILSDIPLLGELFSSSRVTRQETELIIFVTPSIYKEIPSLSEELSGD